MFGNASQPSIIFRYGAREPVQNAEAVHEQMRLAHRYRNSHVERELERRRRIAAAMRESSPELVGVESSIESAEKELENAVSSVHRDSMMTRRRIRMPGAIAEIKNIREKLSRLYFRRRELRSALKSAKDFVDRKNRVETWNRAEIIRLRSDIIGQGLYWGSYLHVEGTIPSSGPPPRFQVWRGEGHISVQIQNGMTVTEAFAGRDNRLRIDPVPSEAWIPGGRRLRRTRCWFRIGSDARGGPIWTVIPFCYHRPIPSDASIKWVHLISRRIGTRLRWSVCFVLSRPRGWAKQDCAAEGSVGIHLGWRMVPADLEAWERAKARRVKPMPDPEGQLRDMRVAYWVGSDGDTGELRLPADWIQEMRRVEKIQSARDSYFNEACLAIGLKLRLSENNLPMHDWMREALNTMPQWRSPSRLAALVNRWRSERFAGDDEAFALAEAWMKKDRHLWEFAANLRDQLLRRREDIYRNFAALIRRKYKTGAIQKMTLARVHRNPSPEDQPKDGALVEHAKDACLHSLIGALRTMAELRVVEARNKNLVHWSFRTCSVCGKIYDWDENSARCLLTMATTVRA